MLTRNIVNGVLLKNGRVLMARRSINRPHYPNCWSFPGGHVERGEALETALARELQEEIGIQVVQFHKLTQLRAPVPSPNPTLFHMYLVSDWQGQPKIMDDEHSLLRWMPAPQAAALNDLALPGYSALLKSLA